MCAHGQESQNDGQTGVATPGMLRALVPNGQLHLALPGTCPEAWPHQGPGTSRPLGMQAWACPHATSRLSHSPALLRVRKDDH